MPRSWLVVPLSLGSSVPSGLVPMSGFLPLGCSCPECSYPSGAPTPPVLLPLWCSYPSGAPTPPVLVLCARSSPSGARALRALLLIRCPYLHAARSRRTGRHDRRATGLGETPGATGSSAGAGGALVSSAVAAAPRGDARSASPPLTNARSSGRWITPPGDACARCRAGVCSDASELSQS